MLGDGNLNIPKCGINARFIIRRSLKDEEYLRWQYSLFKEYTTQEPTISSYFDIRTNKTYHHIYFYTKHLDIFTEYYNKWYNGIKIIPSDLQLDPMLLLTWFLDDGCVVNKNGRLDLKLSTDCFSKIENEFLADLLYQRYDSHFSINQDKNSKWKIVAADESTRRFLREIDPICPDFMSRKSNKWRQATDIFDVNIKSFKSRKLNPIVNEDLFNEAIKSFNQFTTKDIAQYCNLFTIKNGKKVLYYDAIKIRLDKLILNNKIELIGSFNKKKYYKAI